jgi:hypothetical protein
MVDEDLQFAQENINNLVTKSYTFMETQNNNDLLDDLKRLQLENQNLIQLMKAVEKDDINTDFMVSVLVVCPENHTLQ